MSLREFPAAMVTALDNASLKMVGLVELRTDPVRRFALWDRDIPFDGFTWTAIAGTFGPVESTLRADRTAIELRLWADTVRDIANASGNGIEYRSHVITQPVESDPAASISELRWFLSGGNEENGFVSWRVAAPRDALDLIVPIQLLGSPTCGVDYKSLECGSESTLIRCPKHLTGCRRRFNKGATLRIGPSNPLMTKATRRRR